VPAATLLAGVRRPTGSEKEKDEATGDEPDTAAGDDRRPVVGLDRGGRKIRRSDDLSGWGAALQRT
jgi:hypothetical protein